MGKKLQCDTHSEEAVHPCTKHSFKMAGNGSAITHKVKYLNNIYKILINLID
jgi:hypothetical protein